MIFCFEPALNNRFVTLSGELLVLCFKGFIVPLEKIFFNENSVQLLPHNFNLFLKCLVFLYQIFNFFLIDPIKLSSFHFQNSLFQFLILLLQFLNIILQFLNINSPHIVGRFGLVGLRIGEKDFLGSEIEDPLPVVFVLFDPSQSGGWWHLPQLFVIVPFKFVH